MESIRDSLILSFGTAGGRTRSLRLPGPAPGLDSGAVAVASGRIIMADIFDSGAGPLQRLDGAVHESVRTVVLI